MTDIWDEMTKRSRIFGFALLLSALFSASADEVRNTYPTAEGLDVKVAPIIEAAWYQQLEPFTNLTPRDADGYPCMAGCVAIALSQVMWKDRMPSGPIAPFSNECTVDGEARTLSVDGKAYDWDNMPGSVYQVELSEAQQNALAKLASDVGIAVGMSYTAEFSGADLAQAAVAMTNRFGYASVKYVSTRDDGLEYDQDKGSFNFEKYLTIIRENLDRGRPVLVSFSGDYNHAVIIDGYGTANGETYYHANLGGGARYNAWYRLPYVTSSDIDFWGMGHDFNFISELVYDIELPTSQETTEPDYIVISPPAYVDLWTWYVGERAKLPGGQGHTFGVKNAQEIYDAYPPNKDATDGSPRNHAESIHKWIGEQAAKGTKYFVLGGNWFDAQNLEGERAPWGDRGDLQTQIPGIVTYPFTSLENADTLNINPSDLYYACHFKESGAKYVWDTNGDGIYVGLREGVVYELDEDGNMIYAQDPINESWYPVVLSNDETKNDHLTDPRNFQPSVVVSRIAFYEKNTTRTYEDMVRSYLEKLKRGESSEFEGKDNYVVWVTPCLGNDADNRPDVYGVMKDRYEAIADYRATTNRMEFFVRMGDEVDNDPRSAKDMTTLLTGNWEVFLPFGHGTPDAFAGIDGSVFANNNGLIKFFMANIPCLTGSLNAVGNPAVMGLANPSGGTLVSVNNSSYGWATQTGIQQRYLGISDELVDWCMDAYIRDNTTAGEAWRRAIAQYSGIVFDPETGDAAIAARDYAQDKDCVYAAIVEEILFGDPLVKIDYGDPVPKRRVPKVIFR